MTADRATGTIISVPLVWTGQDLRIALGRIDSYQGYVDECPDGWIGFTFDDDDVPIAVGTFPTRAEAERAVEAAVMKAMGEVG